MFEGGRGMREPGSGGSRTGDGAPVLALALVAAFAVWAVCAWFDLAGQRSLFYERGQEELYDYWMPRMCVEQGYSSAKSADYGIDPASRGVRAADKAVGETVEFSDWYPSETGLRFVTGDMDKVYPALALMPYRLFPATRTGGWCFSVLCAAVFLLSLVLVGRRCVLRGPSAFLFPLSLVLSMPFLFALERGNPVWLSAAAVGVFLAWWDDERGWKRLVAAVCLAFAAVMKIAPAALGLLYLLGASGKKVERRGGGGEGEGVGVVGEGVVGRLFSFVYAREIAVAAIAFLVLFIVPWLFVKDGFAAVPIMMKNAAHHADFVLRTADFGFIQLWRAVRVALGQGVGEPWAGMYLVGRLSQLFGLVALVFGARRRDYLLLVGGMLFAAGNMYYYAALYLFPVLLMSDEVGLARDSLRASPFASAAVSLVLWFAILCPLQLMLLGHSANANLCNSALLALMLLRMADKRTERGRYAFDP